MEIVFDPSSFMNFINLPADEMLWRMLLTIGWIPIAITFLWGFFELWMHYIQGQFFSKQKFIFLAIDVPRGNETSPKAAENMFTYLGGAHGSINFLDKYWEGKFQLAFSFEIVSLGGYTQFVVRAPEGTRDMVETAVYSQYPDAEITEIEDYTKEIPGDYPNDEYDVMGAEFTLSAPSPYPIKRYEEFEHKMGKPEFQFRDPMASLMDLCSSLREGENLWIQMIVIPIDFAWLKDAEAEIGKLVGDKKSVKPGFFGKLIDGVFGILGDLTGLALVSAPKKEEKVSFNMMALKPGDKRKVEMIQEKMMKLGFGWKMRVVYVAKKEVMNKGKGFGGFVGYIKQFTNDINGIKPDMKITATSTAYFGKTRRLNLRKRTIVARYKGRSGMGLAPCVLNIEELATLWHFPIETVVRAPLIQKAPGRKAEPPISLPLGMEVFDREEEDSIFRNLGNEGNDSLSAKAQAVRAEIDSIFVDEPPRQESKQTTAPEIDSVFTDEPIETVRPVVPKPSVDSLTKKEAEENVPDNLPFV